MSFIVSALPVEAFRTLFGRSEAELRARGVERRVADAAVGFPCRITLEDAPVGESLLLLNYEHQSASTPYRSSYAIFVRESASRTASIRGALPEMVLRRSWISVRAFSGEGHLQAAEVSPGAEAQRSVERLLARKGVDYLHLHNAAHGCYLARVDRG